ncbi:hypothetical protein ABK040_010040 [Willaertia magna]
MYFRRLATNQALLSGLRHLRADNKQQSAKKDKREVENSIVPINSTIQNLLQNDFEVEAAKLGIPSDSAVFKVAQKIIGDEDIFSRIHGFAKESIVGIQNSKPKSDEQYDLLALTDESQNELKKEKEEKVKQREKVVFFGTNKMFLETDDLEMNNDNNMDEIDSSESGNEYFSMSQIQLILRYLKDSFFNFIGSLFSLFKKQMKGVESNEVNQTTLKAIVVVSSIAVYRVIISMTPQSMHEEVQLVVREFMRSLESQEVY